jgi:hypothetical protein
MWSGHLTSANSDVRAGDNYRRHGSRWAGLVNWWQEVLGSLSAFERGDHPFNQMVRLNPTPLPPDRTKGAPIAQVYEAMQEFLRDWLIDQDYDEALDFVSDQALACVNLEDSFSQTTLSADQLRKHLRDGMQQMHSSLGAFADLTNAIEAVTPWRKSFKIVEHPFSREFALFRAPAEVAKAFACQDRSDAKLTAVLDDPNPTYADDYGSWFRFRLVNGQGAVIAIHWKRVAGQWKIQAWKLHEP